MEDRLWRVFDNVNRWLDYAERKNAILLTFIGMQLTIGKTFIDSPSACLLTAASVLAVCFLICLFSFFPQTAIPSWLYFWAKSSVAPESDDNLLFYAHIAKYSVARYTEVLETYYAEPIREHRHLVDICTQIVVNSKIAYTKYSMFKAATWFMIAGQVLLLASFWG